VVVLLQLLSIPPIVVYWIVANEVAGHGRGNGTMRRRRLRRRRRGGGKELRRICWEN